MSSQNASDGVRSQIKNEAGLPAFINELHSFRKNGEIHTIEVIKPVMPVVTARVQIQVEEIKPKLSFDDVIANSKKGLSDLQTSQMLSTIPQLAMLKDYNETARKSAKVDKEVGKIALAYSNTAHDGSVQNIAAVPTTDTKGPGRQS